MFEHELYAGLAGIDLPVEQFELGLGLVLQKTYVRISSPLIGTFAPASKDNPFGGKVAAMGEGFGIAVDAIIVMPDSFNPVAVFGQLDKPNTCWWLAALLRLRGHLLVSLPFVTDKAISDIRESGKADNTIAFETQPRRLRVIPEVSRSVSIAELNWIKENWIEGLHLWLSNSNFHLAFRAADSSIWQEHPAVGLLQIWAGLESLFSPSSAELRFRLASLISSYLEVPGESRVVLYKRILKLYDTRSKIAHGDILHDDAVALQDSYRILQSALIRMIERRTIPTVAQLEGFLLKGNQ